MAQIKSITLRQFILLTNYGIKFREISKLSFGVLGIGEYGHLISLTKLIP